MNQPPLHSTSLGTNTNNKTMSTSDSIPVGKKLPEHTTLTLHTDLTEKKGKAHVPGEPDQDPSLSDSSPKKYNSSNDSNSSKSNKRKLNKR